jgi:hypothetical protein
MAARRSIGVLWLVIGVAITSTQASEESRVLADELVRTMKADDQVIELAEKLILSRCQVEKCDEELRQCLFKFDREEFMGKLVHIAEREFTPAEMKAGITYFRTEIGEKHRQVMRAELGLAKASLSDQIPEERVAMLAFLDTPAGYRLVTRALLTNSDQVRGMILNLAGRAFDRCRP